MNPIFIVLLLLQAWSADALPFQRYGSHHI